MSAAKTDAKRDVKPASSRDSFKPATKESEVWLSSDRAQSAVVVCLAFALFLLSLMGVGLITLSCLLGLLLCIVGFCQRAIKIDPWIFFPLVVFTIFNFASSLNFYGNIVSGYAPAMLVYVVIYALIGALNPKRSLLLKKLCVLWVAVVALIGVFQFSLDAFIGTAGRLRAVLGNANSLGIFLVLGWFALVDCKMEDKKLGYRVSFADIISSDPHVMIGTDSEGHPVALKPKGTNKKAHVIGGGSKRRRPVLYDRAYAAVSWIIPFTEPLILVAMLLTLSMGSLCALALGIIVMFICKKRASKNLSWQDVFNEGVHEVAKIVVCFAAGLLMFVTAERTEAPIICEALLIYVCVLAVFWDRFCEFLTEHKKLSLAIALVCIILAVVAIILRPSAFATFGERLAMIQNGAGYLFTDPLFGVGPYQWRLLNIEDADMYFNVWHIHNGFIHIGVEAGLIAMISLVIVAVRCFMKKHAAAQQGENTSFLFHMLFDTGFFMVGIVSLFIMTAGKAKRSGFYIKYVGTKMFFAICGFVYLDILITSLQIL